jgi:diadenosine tetraphosphate (Ap4A) HIT family hydrolase
MDCPFCDAQIKERQGILHEGEEVFVMLSNPRKVPGHLLVIPKRHVEKLADLAESERKELLDMLIDFQEKVVSKIASGCDIRQHYRPFLPQSRLKVDHVHFHLIPRELDDELYEKSMKFEGELFKDLTEEEREKMIKMLRE